MTAINMVVQRRARAAFIMADTAITDEDGKVIDFTGKVALGTGRFPFAIGVSGNVLPRVFAAALGEANPANLKQLMKRLPDVMRTALRRQEMDCRAMEGDCYMLLRGAAWDFARKQPVGFVMVSDGALFPGAEPFSFYETEWCVTLADGATSLGDMLGRDMDPTDPAQFDPETDGVQLMIEQHRRGASPLMPGLRPQTPYRIGGEAQLIEVRKTGVTVWAVHDFGDELGQVIDPRKEPCVT